MVPHSGVQLCPYFALEILGQGCLTLSIVGAADGKNPGTHKGLREIHLLPAEAGLQDDENQEEA